MTQTILERPAAAVWTKRAAELLARAEVALELTARPSREGVRLARELCLEALREFDHDRAEPTSGAGRIPLRQLLRRLRHAQRSARRSAGYGSLCRQLRRKGLRVGAIVALALAGLAGFVALWSSAIHPDVLAGRRFWTSSSWATCDPVHGSCGGRPTRIFFHTNDELEPFIEYDLGETRSLSRVLVTNRRDSGLADRALPLLVETSVDGQVWREVRRRDYWFDVWQADFAKVKARYLRLKVGRRSILHLERVQAFE